MNHLAFLDDPVDPCPGVEPTFESRALGSPASAPPDAATGGCRRGERSGDGSSPGGRGLSAAIGRGRAVPAPRRWEGWVSRREEGVLGFAQQLSGRGIRPAWPRRSRSTPLGVPARNLPERRCAPEVQQTPAVAPLPVRREGALPPQLGSARSCSCAVHRRLSGIQADSRPRTHHEARLWQPASPGQGTRRNDRGPAPSTGGTTRYGSRRS